MFNINEKILKQKISEIRKLQSKIVLPQHVETNELKHELSQLRKQLK